LVSVTHAVKLDAPCLYGEVLRRLKVTFPFYFLASLNAANGCFMVEAAYVVVLIVLALCLLVLCFLARLHYLRAQGHKGCVLDSSGG
jgi:hypothetical protein